jgi:hypothetical protein
MTQQEFVSLFVGRIVEDLFINFTGETLSAFGKQEHLGSVEQVRQKLDEITRQRQKEEQ